MGKRRERVGKEMETVARARRLEVDRTGAIGVHAVSGVDGVRPRGGLPLCSVGRACAGARERRQSRGAGGSTRLVRRKRGGSPLGEKRIFKFPFLNIFQISDFKYHFEQENDFF
jgi:hypothetical protein